MTKWYQKPIYIVTKNNFISVLLSIFTLFTYVVEKIHGQDKTLGNFFLSITIGQFIGSKVINKKRENMILFLLLILTFISYIIEMVIGSGIKITVILLGLTIGQPMGYSIAKTERKGKKVNLKNRF